MHNEPLVTVIMPSYNSSSFIKESVESIINQSYGKWELLITDDNSIDDTIRIVENLKINEPRIKLFKNEKNMGPAFSRNICLENAEGKYIAILDSDDLADRERLEEQVDYLEKNDNIFLLATSAILIDEKGNILRKSRQITDPLKLIKRLEKKNAIYHSSVMYRNIKGLNYRTNIESEDYDFYLRLLTDGEKIAGIEEPLISYRIRANSNSFSKSIRTRLVSEKLVEFYRERIRTGTDSYSEFDQEKYINKRLLDKKDMTVLKTKIKDELLFNFEIRDKKEYYTYFKEYGIFNRVFILFFISFLPYKIRQKLFRKSPIALLRIFNQ